MEDSDNNIVPPVVPPEEGEQVDDFASVVAEQSATIRRQEEQISKLLEAVANMTRAGANYQQGEPPMTDEKAEGEEDPYKDVKPLAELDFKI